MATMTPGVGNQTRHTQEIFNHISANYNKKVPEFDAECGFFSIGKSNLERRVSAFTNGHIVNTPTEKEFANEISMYTKICKALLDKIVEVKKLQQECHAGKEYLRPHLIADTLASIKELDPGFHKLMLEDAEVCKRHFAQLKAFGNDIKDRIENMEKESKDFRSSLLEFEQIAHNKGAPPGIISKAWHYLANTAVPRSTILECKEAQINVKKETAKEPEGTVNKQSKEPFSKFIAPVMVASPEVRRLSNEPAEQKVEFPQPSQTIDEKPVVEETTGETQAEGTEAPDVEAESNNPVREVSVAIESEVEASEVEAPKVEQPVEQPVVDTSTKQEPVKEKSVWFKKARDKKVAFQDNQ